MVVVLLFIVKSSKAHRSSALLGAWFECLHGTSAAAEFSWPCLTVQQNCRLTGALSHIFSGVSLAGVSCHRRTTLATEIFTQTWQPCHSWSSKMAVGWRRGVVVSGVRQ